MPSFFPRFDLILAFAACSLQTGPPPPLPRTTGADLRTLIRSAVAEGRPRVLIPPGVYRMAPEGKDGVILAVRKARNLEIVAEGVRMICTRRMRALMFERCENVTLRGLTVDYDPLTFTQGRVVAMAGDKGWLDIEIDAGYPRLLLDRIVICDPRTRFHKHGIDHLWGTKAAWKGPGIVRIERKDVARNVDLGDPVALSGGPEAGACHGITIENGCSGILFRSVTLHCAPGMGIVEAGSETGVRLINCRIVAGPKPAGATEERLLTTSWDGIQCNPARKGAQVEDCVIERCGDDSWSVTARDFPVYRKDGRTILTRTPGFELRVGDRLRQRSGQEAVVQAMKEVLREEAGLEAAVAERLRRDRQEVLGEVTLDRELPLKAGQGVYNPDCRSRGFVYRNNRIYSHGRGALVKVGDGLIEGNVFRGGDKAIVVNPEIDTDAGGADRLVIRNNVIRETGYHQAMPWSEQAGAVCLSAGMGGGRLRPAGMFNAIRIEGNTFDTVKGLNLLISSARDVVVRGNRFLNTHAMDPGHHNGAAYRIDATAVVAVIQSENVRFEDNVIEKLGPFAVKAAAVDETSRGVTGAETGLVVRSREK